VSFDSRIQILNDDEWRDPAHPSWTGANCGDDARQERAVASAALPNRGRIELGQQDGIEDEVPIGPNARTHTGIVRAGEQEVRLHRPEDGLPVVEIRDHLAQNRVIGGVLNGGRDLEESV